VSTLDFGNGFEDVMAQIKGQGKPTARISANINGLSAFPVAGGRGAESGRHLVENVYVDLPGPSEIFVQNFHKI